MLKFTKMNGAGNDFILIDNREKNTRLRKETIIQLCDRNRGIGADGILVVESARNGADFRMRYYNRDGGEAEMCGNGARCFARYAGRIGNKAGLLSFETEAGVVQALTTANKVTLEISPPKDLQLNQKISITDQEWIVHSINTGVPHAVIFVDDITIINLQTIGSAIRYHEAFSPKGTNVNFVQKVDDNSISIRTYERGVEGETLACGTGVVASALIFNQLQDAPSPIDVVVRGGDILEVNFERSGTNYHKVRLTGPADFVFEGEIEV